MSQGSRIEGRPYRLVMHGSPRMVRARLQHVPGNLNSITAPGIEVSAHLNFCGCGQEGGAAVRDGLAWSSVSARWLPITSDYFRGFDGATVMLKVPSVLGVVERKGWTWTLNVNVPALVGVPPTIVPAAP